MVFIYSLWIACTQMPLIPHCKKQTGNGAVDCGNYPCFCTCCQAAKKGHVA